MIMPREPVPGQGGNVGARADYGHLKVFNHHVYEYRKGLRRLALQTLPAVFERWVSWRLEKLGIDHLFVPAGLRHINVFLGDAVCLEVVRRIGKRDLSCYTPEEDFILGIMLGYDRRQQCTRYLALTRRDGGEASRWAGAERGSMPSEHHACVSTAEGGVGSARDVDPPWFRTGR
jgi:hypothetical protein